jgi:hypothetical protein
MSTLDNLNSNILVKIDIIEKIINICINDLKLPIFENNNMIILNKNLYYNTPLSFNQNLKILNKRYSLFIDKKYIYEVQSIVFLTEYYSLDNINKTYKIANGIYNDNIFLLSSTSLNNNILSNDDILLLKQIYYNNYYKYKVFKSITNQSLAYNKLINIKLSKKIYHNFNIFISSEDFYGIFDNLIDFIYEFLVNFKPMINQYILNIDTIFKKIFQLINQYKKTQLIYNIEDIEYDLCSCGNKMIIQSNTSELLCTNCGSIHTLIGSVFENSQFYQQEGNRYMHGTYDPNRHCKFWIDRIQAKENTIINDASINKIKQCIKKDKIENLKNISIDQFRIYLKQTKLSKLNDHIPLIKKMITGYIPPQLNHKELHLLFNYFDKATKIYNQIKPKEKSNSLYYPFLIWKILDLIITDLQKKKELLNCIHLQSYETLIDNDKIWYQICKHNDKFIYKPTDKSILY